MMNAALLEVCARLRAAELEQRKSQPVPPPKPDLWTAFRQRLARRLVALGLCLDAEASRAATSSLEAAPQPNGSDG